MDEERHRISLGMKNLDAQDDMDSSKEESDEEISKNGSIDDDDVPKLKIFPESSFLEIQGMDVECKDEECSVLAQGESRASIPPLEVTLDDIEPAHLNDEVKQNQGHIDRADIIDKKKQAKKKPKKLRSF